MNQGGFERLRADLCLSAYIWESFAWDSELEKEESEKVGLKLNIQKTKIMAFGPITSWQIEGEKVTNFIFLGSKSLQMVTAAMKLKDAYSLEGKLWPT